MKTQSLTKQQCCKRYMYAEAVEFFKANHITCCDLVQSCFKDHLATQETDLLSQAITLLATHGYEKKTTVS